MLAQVPQVRPVALFAARIRLSDNLRNKFSVCQINHVCYVMSETMVRVATQMILKYSHLDHKSLRSSVVIIFLVARTIVYV